MLHVIIKIFAYCFQLGVHWFVSSCITSYKFSSTIICPLSWPIYKSKLLSLARRHHILQNFEMLALIEQANKNFMNINQPNIHLYIFVVFFQKKKKKCFSSWYSPGSFIRRTLSWFWIQLKWYIFFLLPFFIIY